MMLSRVEDGRLAEAHMVSSLKALWKIYNSVSFHKLLRWSVCGWIRLKKICCILVLQLRLDTAVPQS